MSGPARGAPVVCTLAALSLGACSGLTSRAPAVQTYVLAPAPSAAASSAVEASLQVVRPTPHPGLESDRIALLHPDRRLDYYASSRWAGPLPQVIEALAVDTLRSSGAFEAVYDDRTPFAAAYVLRMTIRHFEARYEGGTPRVQVSLDCTLGRRSDRGAVASFSVEASADAGANRLGAVVAAFERASQQALSTVRERVAEAIAGQLSASRASAGAEPPARASQAAESPAPASAPAD